jgi:hypothetical protein
MGKKRAKPKLRAANDPEPLVNAFAARHGDYGPAADTGEMRKAMRNNGGSALSRWIKAGLLSEHQQAAIMHCLRLWRLAGTEPRVTANLDRTVFGSPGDGNPDEIQARDDIFRISRDFPGPYWNIFENVCRFDEPAGTAGSRLASISRSQAEGARLVVCMVADMIYMRERLSY